MDNRTIDLTVQAPPQLKVLLVTLGALHIIGGLLFINGGNDYFGFLNLALGPMWMLWGLFYSRINRHLIVIHKGRLEICRGLFRNRRIPWASISEIRFESARMEIRVNTGRSATVKFGAMSHRGNQTIKHEFVSKISRIAEVHGVSIVGG